MKPAPSWGLAIFHGNRVCKEMGNQSPSSGGGVAESATQTISAHHPHPKVPSCLMGLLAGAWGVGMGWLYFI